MLLRNADFLTTIDPVIPLEKLLSLFDRLGTWKEFSSYEPLINPALEKATPNQQHRLLRSLALRYQNIDDIATSMRFIEQALTAAQLIPDIHLQADCYEIISNNHCRLGRSHDARQTAACAYSLRLYSNDYSDLDSALGALAGASYLEGDYQNAISLMTIASRFTNHSGRSKKYRSALNNMAILLMESGRLHEALAMFKHGLIASQRSENLIQISLLHYNLSLCYAYLGQISQAMFHMVQAESAHAHAGAFPRHQETLLTKADLFRIRGFPSKSLQVIELALKLSESVNDPITYAYGILHKAQLLCFLGDGVKADMLLDSALSETQLLRFPAFAHLVGLLRTRIALVQGHLAQAERCFQSVKASATRQHMVCSLAHLMLASELRYAQGDYSSAHRHAQAALALAKRYGNRPVQFESLLMLTRTYLEQGDLDSAERSLRRLLGSNSLMKYRLLEPWLFLYCSDYAAKVGESEQNIKYLWNARNSLLELSHNIHDQVLAATFLRTSDCRTILERSDAVEDVVYAPKVLWDTPTRSLTTLEGICRVNEQLNRRSSLESSLLLVLEEALRLSGAERGIIFLFDPDGQERQRVSINLARGSLVEARNYTRTALHRIRRGEVVYTADAPVDPDYRGSHSITRLKIRSVLCVPMRARSSIIGAIYLDSRKPGLVANIEVQRALEIFSQQAAAALERTVLYFDLEATNRDLISRLQSECTELVGHGRYFNRLRKLISAASCVDLPALILGESGTGKELVAKLIHECGPRKNLPFLSVDCGALPENLVESELFGFKRGSFTGAERDKTGLFSAAGDGTLFLDEIGNTSLSLQSKLLRALQEKEFRPLGSIHSVHFRARLVAATNRDLHQEVREGRFREDLLFRLSGIVLEIPPLRDRPEDIPLLIRHLLKKAMSRIKRRIGGISQEAMRALALYRWPGNVRELENSLEFALTMMRGDTIALDDLPPAIREGASVSWSEKRAEHRMIEEALIRFFGDKTRAADYIGWNRQKLYRKIKQYNIPIDFGRRNTT
jgi:transcriptional regulator with GAF, ATPase, and Fis domain